MRSSELAVIEHLSEEAELPANYEPVQTEHGRLAIADLVEDELLLALPQIPRKPGLQNVTYSTGGEVVQKVEPPKGVKKNPFAVLQDMLKQDKPE